MEKVYIVSAKRTAIGSNQGSLKDISCGDMGATVVKKIIEEHGGRIQLANNEAGGACVKITLPLLVRNDAKQ